MFNGIIKNQALFEDFSRNVLTLKISNLPASIDIGDSIAVNGVCLTVTSINSDLVTFDLLDETCKRTNLTFCKNGDVLNIEYPITMNDMISGHMVSGHIDFVSKLVSINNEEYTFELPSDFVHLVVSKGSITINGVALTSCEAKQNTFSVYLIPETLKFTNLSSLKHGDHVNIEIDMLARYVDRILTYKK